MFIVINKCPKEWGEKSQCVDYCTEEWYLLQTFACFHYLGLC